MIMFLYRITKESIIDVCAVVKTTPNKIESCSQQDVELHVKQVGIQQSGTHAKHTERLMLDTWYLNLLRTANTSEILECLPNTNK